MVHWSKRSFVTSVSLVGMMILGSLAGAAETQTAGDLLPRLQKRRERVRTLHHKTTATVKDASGTLTRTVTVETWEHRKDGKRRFRTVSRTKPGATAKGAPGLVESLTVSDGTHTWREVHRGDTVLVIKSATKPDAANFSGLIKAGRARIKKQEKINQEPCFVIETGTDRKNGKSTARYWISESYGLILKSVIHQRDGSVAETVTDVLVVNEPLSGVTFSYTPPEGARVLDADALGKSGG